MRTTGLTAERRRASGPAPARRTPIDLQALTVLLTALAVAGVEWAVVSPASGVAEPWLWTGACIIGAGVLQWWLGCREKLPPVWLKATILAVAVASPLVRECVILCCANQFDPGEILLLTVCRNLALSLLALSREPRLCRLCGALDLFLILVTCSIEGQGGQSGSIVLLLAFAGVGWLWLMLAHWKGRPDAGVTTRRGRFPIVAAAAALLPVAGAAAFSLLAPDRALDSLRGFMPTSGGTQTANPAARNGIGNGNDWANGDHPTSTGFEGGNTFADSPQPCLYDAFIKAYGEPLKRKDIEKAFRLSMREVKLSDAKTELDLRQGREFAIARRAPRPAGPREPHAADALFNVTGPVPLHLRIAAYDRFDGSTWEPAPWPELGLTHSNPDAGSWMVVDGAAEPDVASAAVSHELRFGTYRDDVVPTPAALTGFRMGRVNDASFYTWAPAGMLKLARRTVPPGAMIEVESRPFDPSDFPGARVGFGQIGKQYQFSTDGQGHQADPAVIELAHQWSDGVPRGWEQVRRIVAHLRASGTWDAAPPVVNEKGAPDLDVVGDFLVRRRRGPDYLFASSAVVLLRELNYAARLVGGFYVSPGQYDPATGQTPVLPRNAHFWAEIRLADGRWAPLEPTPGFELERPVMPWHRAWASAAVRWLSSNGVALSTGTVAVALLLAMRLRLMDAAMTLGWYPWRTGRAGEWRVRVLATMRLLDRRLSWAGRGRPLGVTPARWFVSADLPAVFAPDLADLSLLAEWAAFAPSTAAPPFNRERIVRTCRRLVAGLPAHRLRPAGGSFSRPRYSGGGQGRGFGW